MLLLFLSGDPYGFGSIASDLIASAAGGPAGPVSPGQIIALFRHGLGPDPDVPGVFDETGGLATAVAETGVFMDGIAAPVDPPATSW